MQKSVAQKLEELPQKPGVYLFKDSAGILLYVGKAIKLKNRVSSYFRKDAGQNSTRIQSMITKIRDFDYVVTDNEVESLVLENNFIKQFQPKYNVRMRDDKNYLFIKINVQDEIPTITYERKITDRKSKYFGPYTNALSARGTLRMLRNIFPYCANTRVGDKPCFYYHIQKCPGVCFGKVSTQEYRETINKIIRFLEGKQSEILKELQGQMKFLAKHKQYEKAAKVRDQIYALNRVLERQKLVYPKKIDQDVFSVHMEPTVSAINLFIIREGKLIQKENFVIENTKQLSEQEILENFLPKYYLDATNLPKEILLPTKINPNELISILFEKSVQLNSRRKINLLTPSLGTKMQLMKLGKENARQYLETQSDKKLLEEARLLASLKELQRVLELTQLPGRMECFDISNIQGTNAVGSMVVFDYARPKKEEYRKFKINTKQTPDDFAMMKEMLERRFKRSLSGEETKKWPMPDLIIIDGGKGQLSTAISVLNEFNLNIPIIGLAKRIEEIFLPGKSEPILLSQNSIALFLLQRIRDEAHRFAITYHRKLRSKGSLSSALDQIQGIGPAKKKQLLA
ncbi:MAG: excinuclease ABC subunit UvrC, partial [Candidatus Doudnabacteria bacterium]|nr:excinuclease ABC subunit UvrC [Candidatus Doudnabacteria bacterium]